MQIGGWLFPVFKRQQCIRSNSQSITPVPHLSAPYRLIIYVGFSNICTQHRGPCTLMSYMMHQWVWSNVKIPYTIAILQLKPQQEYSLKLRLTLVGMNNLVLPNILSSGWLIKHKSLSGSNRKAAATAEWPVGQTATARWGTEETTGSQAATALRGKYFKLVIYTSEYWLSKQITSLVCFLLAMINLLM